MAYKPTFVTKSDMKGIAKVVFDKGHTKVKIDFNDPEVYSKTIFVDADNIPANLNQSGEWFVTINSERTEVKNWRPANGRVRAYFEKFVAKKDQKPTPMTHPQYGNRYFQAVFNIVEPKQFAGCTIANTFQYFFTEVQENEKSLLGFENHPKSKYMKPLVDFLDVCGMWEKGAIQYSDNVLPVLERRGKNAHKLIEFNIANGWMDNGSLESAEGHTPKEEPDLDVSANVETDAETETSGNEQETDLSWEE